MSDQITRRKFFSGMGFAAVGLTLSKKKTTMYSNSQKKLASGEEELRIKKYVSLGITGLKVSDIIFGSTSFSNPSVARYAYEQGVNTFDTAENYMDGRAETMLGRALQNIPRDRIVIISKHFGMRAPNEKITGKSLIEKVNASLKRLKTDYLDVAFTHNINSTDFWKNDELMTAYDQLKRAGKIRFSGFSTHNANLMLKECLKPELKNFIQICMFMYNHMEGKVIEPLISELHKRGIGTIAMKTLAGGRQENLKSFLTEKMTYPQAAIGWVLENKSIDCAVISMRSFSHVEEYVKASGKKLTRNDLAVLRKYQKAVSDNYCRVSCNQCQRSCPERVAISDIMRYKMYFEDYGNEKMALDHYARLSNAQKPFSCASCPGDCNRACPFGLEVKKNLSVAHQILSV